MKMLLRKAKPYVLIVGLQFGFAGLYIIAKNTLNRGMNRYALVVYRNAFAALTFAPFAFILERKTRPKMTISIFFHIMALGFLEPVLDQSFGYLGMMYTSATFSSAIMNAVPSVTFIIAVIFRLEKVKIKEARGQAKVIGTVVTFAGALLMTIYKGPVVNLFSSSSAKSIHATSSGGAGADAGKHFIAGTLILLVACVAWSAFYVLQLITLKKYPANLSLSVLVCVLGGLQTAAIALVSEHRASIWNIGWDTRLLGCVYLAIFGSGIAYYVQGMVMKTRGPVFVTAFNPLCMIIVAILGSVILGEQIHVGSIIGGFVIAMGLYTVVWGKSKDYSDPELESPTTTKLGNDQPQELPLSAPNASKFVTSSTTK
ncbi:hypothetical protein FNV43_RR10849 [Rhamnella rubrinervis]|uniref:WAT1-related protein n=1 Tax=Rhamnella rubrinervis TaxID=2594499 RepID=A0A8K0MHB1_9ROSA|nr:hypothetical protein FNV43_RR10849 [Rhamnella rubrinervis]